MATETDTATCTRCGETKPLVEFHRDRGKPNGHKSRCRDCRVPGQVTVDCECGCGEPTKPGRRFVHGHSGGRLFPMQAGERYGRLVVLEDKGQKQKQVDCQCDCGRRTRAAVRNLRSGHTRSCGCLGRERRLKHGHATSAGKSPTYTSWRGMLSRCLDPGNVGWRNYGGRGIAVADRWRDFAVFAFDMGERPEGTSIDRIDPDGNYEPANCRWATPAEQTANRRNPKQEQEAAAA